MKTESESVFGFIGVRRNEGGLEYMDPTTMSLSVGRTEEKIGSDPDHKHPAIRISRCTITIEEGSEFIRLR